MTAASGDFTSLSAIGIEVGRDGSLSLNNAKFDAAVADPAKLSRLFAATSESDDSVRGFGVRFQTLTRAIVDGDGLLPSRTKSLQSQIDSINKQEQRINDRLVLVEARLRKQYSALDTQLSMMQNTSNSLANALSQLPGANSGG
jgi:flagellar hook-associated protein 2